MSVKPGLSVTLQCLSWG